MLPKPAPITMEPIETCPIPIPIIPIKAIKGSLQELLNMPVCRSVEVHKAAPGTGKNMEKWKPIGGAMKSGKITVEWKEAH